MNERQRAESFLLFLKNFLTIISIISIVIVLIFLIQGWIINSEGKPEQTGLLQFRSNVSGAEIQVNGKTLNEKTDTKLQVIPGEYDIKFEKEGYFPWYKKTRVKSGKISWLSYARFVPKKLKTETFFNIENIKDVKFSGDQKTALIVSENSANKLKIYIVEIAESPKIREVEFNENLFARDGVLPADFLKNIASNITIQYSSSNSARAILRWQQADGKFEWIYLDTRNANYSENLSKKYSVNIEKMKPIRGDIMEYFILVDKNIFSMKIGDASLQTPLITNVADYEILNDQYSIITQKDPINNLYSVVIYKNGDRTLMIENGLEDEPKVEMMQYYDEKYIHISTKSEIRIYKDNEWFNAKGMKKYKTIKLKGQVSDLASNPDSSLIQAVSDKGVEIYDIENDKLYSLGSSKLIWLDDKVAYDLKKEGVFMKDFDGQNEHRIFDFETSLPFSLSDNGKYMYGFRQDLKTNKFELIRAKMII